MGSVGWKIPAEGRGWTKVKKLLEWGHGETVVLGSRVKEGWTEAVVEGRWGGGRQTARSSHKCIPHPLLPDPLAPGTRRKDTGWRMVLPTESECVTHNWGPRVAVQPPTVCTSPWLSWKKGNVRPTRASVQSILSHPLPPWGSSFIEVSFSTHRSWL